MILCTALTFRRLRRDREQSVSRCTFSPRRLPNSLSYACGASWPHPTAFSVVSGPRLLVHLSSVSSIDSVFARVEVYSVCSFTGGNRLVDTSVTITAVPLELSEAE